MKLECGIRPNPDTSVQTNLEQMTSKDERSPEDLQKTAEDLRARSLDLIAKFDAAKAQHERRMRRYRFFSLKRRDFWKMPKWLWVPIVCVLSLLFLIALMLAGRPGLT